MWKYHKQVKNTVFSYQDVFKGTTCLLTTQTPTETHKKVEKLDDTLNDALKWI